MLKSVYGFHTLMPVARSSQPAAQPASVDSLPAPAASLCVSSTSYLETVNGSCSTSIATYASQQFMGYCLPQDTSSAAWAALSPIVGDAKVRRSVPALSAASWPQRAALLRAVLDW